MTQTPRKISEEDLLRAEMYGLLSALLARAPSDDMLRLTSRLEGDDTDMGRAIGTLAHLAKKLTAKAVSREFDALFIGLGRGELLPFASYYMTGFLNEKPLARLRADMARMGIVRDASVHEPEDSAASLMEIMGGLIAGRFGAPLSLAAQRDVFNTHIAPWAGHFFADLEQAKGSTFYAPVGTIGRLFIEIETEAFRMTGR